MMSKINDDEATPRWIRNWSRNKHHAGSGTGAEAGTGAASGTGAGIRTIHLVWKEWIYVNMSTSLTFDSAGSV